MSTKWTKGPWELKHIHGNNFAVQEFSIRGVFMGKKGISPIFNKDTSAIDGTTVFCSPGDASLIAAAPLLYEALESLHAVQNGPPLLRYEKEWDEAMRKAEAAMEAARGEAIQNIPS